MSLIERIHGRFAYDRRAHTLVSHLAELIPQRAKVLDIGCGDGLIAHLIKQRRPEVNITGVDVLLHGKTFIPIETFDGRVVPFADDSFDVAMFVDVLHHTEDPMILLREAARVAREAIVIKDHTCNGLFAGPTLRFMDRVGNARHGVTLPYNYWAQGKWLEAFDVLGLAIDVWKKDLSLYPWPAGWVFGRSLHFVARLDLGAKPVRPRPSTVGASSQDEGSEPDAARTVNQIRAALNLHKKHTCEGCLTTLCGG